MVVSIAIGGAFIGSLIGGPITNLRGRRDGIIIADIIFASAGLIMAMANSFGVLLVGRAVAGLAVGISSMSVPIYISECSTHESRGMMVTLYLFLVTLGMFIASGVASLIV